ncbi:MAG TPA: NUDIX hydrolase [Candidatus Acidoferrales bacterium]|nr:NUDIX hydrolase [Candidatus Acidoferrales bacterium]
MRPPTGSSLYRRLARRELYRNPWVAVDVYDMVHPTGVAGEHVSIAAGRASGVLVLDGDAFVLARQARFAADAQVLEIVKGGADEGESALACAQRELREELGLEAASWTPLGVAYEIPSIVEHAVALFLARDVRAGVSAPEGVEAIESVRMDVEDAYRAASDGRIDDAVTLAALLRYRLLISGTGH